MFCALQYFAFAAVFGIWWNRQPSSPPPNESSSGTVAYTVTVNVNESESMPSDTVTLSVWAPFWDSVGVQANAPVELFIVAPLGGPTRL